MNTRILGNTGVELSEVGFGAVALFDKDVIENKELQRKRRMEPLQLR